MSATDLATDQLRSLVERILRLKEEQDALAADIKDIYAEAKGNGFDKTALGRLVAYVRKVEKDGDKQAEADAIFALYLDAYENAPRTRMREPAREARDSTPARILPVAQDEGQPVKARTASDDAPERGAGELIAGQSEEFVTVTGTGEAAVTAGDPVPAPDDAVSRESASEASPAASREGAQMHAVEPSPATDTAHGSVTPTVGQDADAGRCSDTSTGTSFGPVVKSGVTSPGGEQPGAVSELRTDGCKAAPVAERHDGTEEAESQIGALPDPGSVNDRVARCEIRGGHTLSPERAARLAEYEAKRRVNLPPLDPAHPLFAIRFKVRHGRDPDDADAIACAALLPARPPLAAEGQSA